jgi:hypothetical protein
LSLPFFLGLSNSFTVEFGGARSGKVWRGWVGQGVVWLGLAGRGLARSGSVGLGAVWLGGACRGAVWQGMAWFGGRIEFLAKAVKELETDCELNAGKLRTKEKP